MHSNKRSPKSTRSMVAGVFATATVVALTLAGCSSEPSSGADATGSVTDLKVVQTISHEMSMAGAEAANYFGLFPDDISVTTTVTADGTQALAAGSADIALGAPSRVMGAIQGGLPATIVGPSQEEFDQVIITCKGNPAKTVEDLKGTNFGISNFASAGEYAIRQIAATEGWADSDFNLVTLGNQAGLVAGCENGTIGAFTWGAFVPYQLVEDGNATVIAKVRGKYMGPTPTTVITVSNQLIESNPAAVKAFCTGYYSAQDKLQNDAAAAEALYADEWKVGSADVVQQGLDNEMPILATSPALTDEQLTNMVDATKFTVESASNMTLDDAKAMYKNCDDL